MTANSTYALPQGVTLKRSGTDMFLVRACPLQAMRLKADWWAFFDQMNDRRPRTLPQMAHCPAGVAPLELKRFLDRLAGTGFLNCAGVAGDSPLPEVSVIIPVRDRPQDLEVCLNSLDDLDYPRTKLEIIVVDDGSRDQTAEVARRHSVRLIQNPRSCGASYSRNRGAATARGEILCFLDSDCRVSPRWLRELAALFEDPKVTAGGGLVAAQFTRNALDRYEQVQSSLHMGLRPRDSRDGNPFFYLPSCNLAVRRDRFSAAGGFDVSLSVGEDVDFCWRLMDIGGAIAYRPEALVFHRHRNRLIDFCRRRYDYGTSEPLLQARHRSRRKQLPVWPRAMLFWLFILAAGVLNPWAATAAPLLLLIDAQAGRRAARRNGMSFDLVTLLAAKLRHYLGAAHQLAAFTSRYYLLPAILLLPWPAAATAVAFCHVVVGLVQYRIKKPHLDAGRFLFFFSLEQLAYQSGVWRACLRQGFFASVLPRLRISGAQRV